MDTASDSGGLGRPQPPVLVMPLLWGPQAECQAEEDEGGEAASEDTAFKLRTFSSPKSPSGGDDCLPSGGKGTRKGWHRAGTLESRRPGVSGSSRPLPRACRACPPGPRGFSGASAGQCCLPRTLHRKHTSTRHLSLTSSVAVRAPQARGPSHRGGPLLVVLRAGRARSCVGSRPRPRRPPAGQLLLLASPHGGRSGTTKMRPRPSGQPCNHQQIGARTRVPTSTLLRTALRDVS